MLERRERRGNCKAGMGQRHHMIVRRGVWMSRTHIDEADEPICLVAQQGEAQAEEEREGDDTQNVHVDGRRNDVVGDGCSRDAQQRLDRRPAAGGFPHRLLASK